MKYQFRETITYNQLLNVNKLCLFEGEPFQVLDENRLKSALGNQFQPYENDELAFASVFKSLIINHGFMNGNKRTAAIILYISSLYINDPIKVSDEEFASLIYKIAGEGGSSISVEEISELVFKDKRNVCITKSIPNLEEVIKDYINAHQWLMIELGK